MTQRLRVLIRTLPLEDGNYGGILQAFALQHVIAAAGADPVTDISRSDRDSNVKSLVRRLGVLLGVAPMSWRNRVRNDAAGRELAKFVYANLHTVRLFDMSVARRTEYCASIDLFIAGSDQVWRSRYADVGSYMFSFLGSTSALRASYAASFGSDNLSEYDASLIEKSRENLERFTAVSVREDSGVNICRDEFGIEAQSHVDPTLLLTEEDYRRVAVEPPASADPYIATYVLDQPIGLERMISDISAGLGSDIRSLTHSGELSAGDLGERKILSVPEWLGLIAGSEYVVTDSFHGTVFAIINKVPFVSIVNVGRGASRFESLLNLLGLSGRLISLDEFESESALRILKTPISWGDVHGIIDAEKDRSISYLRDLLAEAER